MTVSASVTSLCPARAHFAEPEAVHFQATEGMDGRTARGDYTDPIASVVRPLLDWTIQVEPDQIS